jgi:hypothetical protein
LEDVELAFGDEPDIEVVELKSTPKGKNFGSEDGNDTMSPEQYKKIQKYMKAMEKLRMPADADRYYWDENAYDLLISSQQRRLMEEYLVQAESEEKQTDEDGNLVVEIDDDLFQYFEDAEYEEEVVSNQQDRKGGRTDRRGGGGNRDFPSKSETQSPIPDIIEHVASTTDEPFPGLEYDTVAPLDIGGPEIEDFAHSSHWLCTSAVGSSAPRKSTRAPSGHSKK